jgi:hypothetical protein
LGAGWEEERAMAERAAVPKAAMVVEVSLVRPREAMEAMMVKEGPAPVAVPRLLPG